jgi:hypothetical protein
MRNRPLSLAPGLALAIGLLLSPVLCTAQAVCPWMNQATASGLVGAPLGAPVLSGSAPSIACTYRAQEKGEATTLEISVVQMSDPATQYAPHRARCRPPGVALTAIGNEAILCRADKSPQTYAERVVGRVRDRAFIVTVSINARSKPPFNRATMEDQAKAVAEQVAGFLF